MDTSAFSAKFQNLPDELKQQVLDFMDLLISRLKQENEQQEKRPVLSLPADLGTPIVLLPHNGSLLPVTPATEKPGISTLTGQAPC